MICKVCHEEFDENRFAQCPYCGAEADSTYAAPKTNNIRVDDDYDIRSNRDDKFDYDYVMNDEDVDDVDDNDEPKVSVGKKFTVVIVAILAGILIFVAGLLLYLKISDGKEVITLPPTVAEATSLAPPTETTTEEPTTEEPTMPESTVYNEDGVALPDFTYEQQDDYKVKSTDGLNVRKGPDTTADKLVHIDDGTSVTVKGYSGTVIGWAYVTVKDGEKEIDGWVKSEFLDGADELAGQKETTEPASDDADAVTGDTTASDADDSLVADDETTTKSENAPEETYASDEQKTKYVDVKDIELNVRSKPSTSGKLITTLADGVEVTVIGQNGTSDDWVYIRFTDSGSENEGWVKSAYLSDTKD